MSRPWGFCEEPSLDIHCTVRQQAMLYDDDDDDDVVVFISPSSLQSHRAAQHQSHWLCQGCHLQSDN